MRRLLSALVLAFASFVVSPAQAGGLLQDLFAAANRPAPAPMYYAPQQPTIRFLYDQGLRVSRRPAAPGKALTKKQQAKRWAIGHHGVRSIAYRARVDGDRRAPRFHAMKGKKKSAAVASAPVATPAAAAVKAAEPALIDNDPTLRVGDAYMTPEGLRIYRGPEARAKERKVFVDFRRSTLGEGVKSQLAALESAARGDHVRRIGSPAIKAIPVGPGARQSVDREGRTIRVVGP